MNLKINKWDSFNFKLNNTVLNKYNFIRSIVKFKKTILNKLNLKQTYKKKKYIFFLNCNV